MGVGVGEGVGLGEGVGVFVAVGVRVGVFVTVGVFVLSGKGVGEIKAAPLPALHPARTAVIKRRRKTEIMPFCLLLRFILIPECFTILIFPHFLPHFKMLPIMRFMLILRF